MTEDYAWTLFRQILDAVVHISSLGIVGALGYIYHKSHLCYRYIVTLSQAIFSSMHMVTVKLVILAWLHPVWLR